MTHFLGLFVLLFPLIMSLVWLVGSVWHFWTRERKIPYTFDETPMVTILIPAHNEEAIIANIIKRIHKLKYEKLEIIVINDGSTDNTAKIIKKIMYDFPKLRFVDSSKNFGKANALWLGTMAANGDYLICVDADAYLDEHSIHHLVAPMLAENRGSNVGAVTGNPKIRNRTNLLTKIQVAEYATIIGMIKRTQQMNNSCMTVSGVCVAFRKAALLDVGLWDKDLITEDIGVTWKLHNKKWKVVFNPNAICWMFVPEKLNCLFKQRARWSLGGIEVLIRHLPNTIKAKDFRNISLLIEEIFTIIWVIATILVLPVAISRALNNDFLFFTIQIKILVTISLINFIVAFFMEQRYDHKLWKNYLAVIWYPLVYWYFNVFVVLTALIKFVKNKSFKLNKKHAIWESPDRGKNSNAYIDEQNYKDSFGEEKIKFSHTRIDYFLFIPLSFFIWFVYLTTIGLSLQHILLEISGVSTIEDVLFGEKYHFFTVLILSTISFSSLLLYFDNVFFWFPYLPKHFSKTDLYQLKCDFFNKKSLSHEQTTKYLKVEENDEINFL